MGSWTVMFRPRLRGIEMKLAAREATALQSVKQRVASAQPASVPLLSERLQDQAHVQCWSGMRERSDADEIDAGLRDRAHGLERDAAARLELGAAGGQRHRLAERRVRHVVEQDARRTGRE